VHTLAHAIERDLTRMKVLERVLFGKISLVHSVIQGGYWFAR
jgi:hypothetical protein